MKKETMDFIDNCTEAGIIDEFQKRRAIDFDKQALDKKDLMMKNFLNLTVALLAVFLILFGILVTYQKFNYINPAIKLSFSGILVAVSLVGIATSRIKSNYFLLELFVCMNVCGILMFIMSANMETAFRYRASTNNFLTAIAMLPVFFTVETYTVLIVYSCVFLTSGIPELNFTYITTPNTILELIVTALYMILLMYKFITLYNNKSKGQSAIYSRYFTNEVMLVFFEILILLFVFRLCFIANKIVDVVFVYIIMLWILIRRTSLFKGLASLPMIVDIFVFFGVIYLLMLDGAKSYNQTVVLTYHTIYYLIVLLLKQKGFLDYTPGIYRLQQYFYINLFIFVFSIDRLLDNNYIWFVVTIILGLFNTYVGVKYKSVVHSVIGFGIVVATLVFTALKVPTTIGGIMFSLSGIAIIVINRNLFRKVLKGYEVETEN